jgi:hypothetical protein
VRNGRILRCGALAAAMLITTGYGVAAQQFSADMVTAAQAQGDRPAQKVYVSDGKVRMEGGNMRGGAVIADANAKTTIVLMPQQKAYMDMSQMGKMGQMMARALMPVDPNNPCPQWQEMAKEAGRNNANNGGNWTCKRVGTETINGRSTIKFEADAANGERHFAWVDPKLRFLVKSQNGEGRGMELKNIQEGPQQASLFEIPAGYQKMDMAQMMRQMMPQGAKPPG